MSVSGIVCLFRCLFLHESFIAFLRRQLGTLRAGSGPIKECSEPIPARRSACSLLSTLLCSGIHDNWTVFLSAKVHNDSGHSRTRLVVTIGPTRAFSAFWLSDALIFIVSSQVLFYAFKYCKDFRLEYCVIFPPRSTTSSSLA